LLLAECKEHEYKIRLSKKCAMIGLPKCPKCNEVLRLDEKSLKAMMSDKIQLQKEKIFSDFQSFLNEVQKDEI
jgi:transcription initiation factor IIE alpha subunit